MDIARVEVNLQTEFEQDMAVGAYTVRVLPGVNDPVVIAANW
jgi:hypothetical protein